METLWIGRQILVGEGRIHRSSVVVISVSTEPAPQGLAEGALKNIPLIPFLSLTVFRFPAVSPGSDKHYAYEAWP